MNPPPQPHADSLNESGLKNYLQDMRAARALYSGAKPRVGTARTSNRASGNQSPNVVRSIE